MARQHPVARVLQRQMEMRRERARSRDQIDDLGRAVHRLERADAEQTADRVPRASPSLSSERTSSSSAATTPATSDRGPYEPRCTPVSAISLKPAAATRSTSRSTSSIGTLRGRPLVVGMMQYAHGSAQPVCTRSVNAVRPATPGSIAAPQLPSPSPNRSAVESPARSDARPRGRHRATSRCGLSSFATTRTTFGSAATSSGRRVA